MPILKIEKPSRSSSKRVLQALPSASRALVSRPQNSRPKSGNAIDLSTAKNWEYRQKSPLSIPSPVSACFTADSSWLLPDSLAPTTVVTPSSSGTLTKGYCNPSVPSASQGSGTKSLCALRR